MDNEMVQLIMNECCDPPDEDGLIKYIRRHKLDIIWIGIQISFLFSQHSSQKSAMVRSLHSILSILTRPHLHPQLHLPPGKFVPASPSTMLMLRAWVSPLPNPWPWVAGRGAKLWRRRHPKRPSRWKPHVAAPASYLLTLKKQAYLHHH